MVGDDKDVRLFINTLVHERLDDFRKVLVAGLDAGQRVAGARAGVVLAFVRLTQPKQAVFRDTVFP